MGRKERMEEEAKSQVQVVCRDIDGAERRMLEAENNRPSPEEIKKVIEKIESALNTDSISLEDFNALDAAALNCHRTYYTFKDVLSALNRVEENVGTLKNDSPQYRKSPIEDIIGTENLKRIETMRQWVENAQKETEMYSQDLEKLEDLRKKLCNKRMHDVQKGKLLNEGEGQFFWAETTINRGKFQEINGPVSKNIVQLSEDYGIGIRPRQWQKTSNQSWSVEKNNPKNNKNVRCVFDIKLIPYEECSPEQKQAIEQKQAKLAELRAKINQGEIEYDKPGKIVLPVYYQEVDLRPQTEPYKTVEFEVTQAELVKAGILPEDLGWKSLEEIEAEKRAKATERKEIGGDDLARLTKKNEVALTETRKGGLKGFVEKLVNLVKGKGKGER